MTDSAQTGTKRFATTDDAPPAMKRPKRGATHRRPRPRLRPSMLVRAEEDIHRAETEKQLCEDVARPLSRLLAWVEHTRPHADTDNGRVFLHKIEDSAAVCDSFARRLRQWVALNALAVDPARDAQFDLSRAARISLCEAEIARLRAADEHQEEVVTAGEQRRGSEWLDGGWVIRALARMLF